MKAVRRDSLGEIPGRVVEAGIPAWFEGAMFEGVVSLSPQPLYRRPESASQDQEMAAAFAKAAWPGRRWEEAADTQRIKVAFELLAKGHRLRGDIDSANFPTAADFISALPRRESELMQESPRPLTEEEQARAESARKRAVSLLAPDPNLFRLKEERLRELNNTLKRSGVPIFLTLNEVRKHQVRQRAAGAAIAAFES